MNPKRRKIYVSNRDAPVLSLREQVNIVRVIEADAKYIRPPSFKAIEALLVSFDGLQDPDYDSDSDDDDDEETKTRKELNLFVRENIRMKFNIPFFRYWFVKLIRGTIVFDNINSFAENRQNAMIKMEVKGLHHYFSFK